jgi:hypothetical protein
LILVFGFIVSYPSLSDRLICFNYISLGYYSS